LAPSFEGDGSSDVPRTVYLEPQTRLQTDLAWAGRHAVLKAIPLTREHGVQSRLRRTRSQLSEIRVRILRGVANFGVAGSRGGYSGGAGMGEGTWAKRKSFEQILLVDSPMARRWRQIRRIRIQGGAAAHSVRKLPTTSLDASSTTALENSLKELRKRGVDLPESAQLLRELGEAREDLRCGGRALDPEWLELREVEALATFGLLLSADFSARPGPGSFLHGEMRDVGLEVGAVQRFLFSRPRQFLLLLLLANRQNSGRPPWGWWLRQFMVAETQTGVIPREKLPVAEVLSRVDGFLRRWDQSRSEWDEAGRQTVVPSSRPPQPLSRPSPTLRAKKTRWGDALKEIQIVGATPGLTRDLSRKVLALQGTRPPDKALELSGRWDPRARSNLPRAPSLHSCALNVLC